jgi:hypothetical protein
VNPKERNGLDDTEYSRLVPHSERTYFTLKTAVECFVCIDFFIKYFDSRLRISANGNIEGDEMKSSAW